VSKRNSNLRYSGKNSIGPIPKECKITFTLSNLQQMPLGSHIQWVVRNEGEEAEYKNDLGHFAGADKIYAEERSWYKGLHYMDLVIKSDLGEVFGFRRIPVRISDNIAPLRNPPKPSYVRIRK
ncbi:MAG TPA: hypothetical protein VMC41_03605, partial [Candidatus Nanoarchaeia archaeon]|nr:hypothetical protein [Candidatus Nanoarchaeia archaeon]